MTDRGRAGAAGVRVLVLAIAIAGAEPARAGADLPPARFADAQRRQKLASALPRIEALMAERQQEIGAPGLAYAVVIDGEVVLAGSAGLRDIAAAAPVDGDTVFRIASMTKSFTALAVLKLRDAGLLNLDDPVARHVPQLRGWPLATADSAPVTLRQLLGHSGGLPEDNPYGDRQLALTPPVFEALLQGGVPQASAPGTAFEYSNLGFMILGQVVSKVSGRPFQDYIRDEILRPLGMNATHWSPAAVPPGRLALGYRKQSESWLPEPMLEDGAGAAMGGLMTTPRDLGRFVAMMLAAWPARDEPERAPALRRTLREMQGGLGLPELTLGRRQPGGLVVGRASSYGYGLQAAIDCGWGRDVEHSGGLPGFGSDMRWLPDHGVGVIVLANLTYAPTGSLARQMLQLLQASGGLQARQAVAAPALLRAARAAGELVLDWSDERALALAADNLFLDQPLAERKAAITALRQGLGRCTAAELKAENALRGVQRMVCEKGWLDVELTLAPTLPPKIQHLEVTAGRPLAPPLSLAVDELLAAAAKGTRDLRLSPKADRAGLAALLESTRLAYGSCRAGEVLEGDGQQQARLLLVCDRGAPELRLSLDGGRLEKFNVRQRGYSACVP